MFIQYSYFANLGDTLIIYIYVFVVSDIQYPFREKSYNRV